MMKMNCNIIGDMLPLYADDVVSDDTRTMVEEHLAECENCREKYEDMKQELCVQTELSAAQAEKQSLISVKKKLKKYRIVTAIFSAIAGVILLLVIVGAMNNIKIPVPYEEERFKVYVSEAGGEQCLYLQYNGKMHGHEMVGMTDADNGEVLYVEIYTTPWRSLFGGSDDTARNEIFCGTLGTLNLEDEKIVELRYITGDYRQFYARTRDYEKLGDDSVLLCAFEYSEEGIAHIIDHS